jgi:hypothetical protein
MIYQWRARRAIINYLNMYCVNPVMIVIVAFFSIFLINEFINILIYLNNVRIISRIKSKFDFFCFLNISIRVKNAVAGLTECLVTFFSDTYSFQRILPNINFVQ